MRWLSVPTAQTPPSQFVQHTGARTEKIHMMFLFNSKTWSAASQELAQDSENILQSPYLIFLNQFYVNPFFVFLVPQYEELKTENTIAISPVCWPIQQVGCRTTLHWLCSIEWWPETSAQYCVHSHTNSENINKCVQNNYHITNGNKAEAVWTARHMLIL